jgi:hypothetical protein
MATKGSVGAINRKTGVAAITVLGGHYTIIELLGDGKIDVGDEMQWVADAALGDVAYANVTKGKIMPVRVRCHGVPLAELGGHLRHG